MCGNAGRFYSKVLQRQAVCVCVYGDGVQKKRKFALLVLKKLFDINRVI